MADAKVKIRKGDSVQVIAGKDSGKRGTVVRVLPERGRVVVEKVNMIKRHTKPRPAPRNSSNQQVIPGGVIEKEAPLNLSNVQLVCPSCGKPTRDRLPVHRRRQQGARVPRLREGHRRMSTVEAPTPRLKERYFDEIRPALQESLGLSSMMAVPRITKITLNMGVGEAKTNAKALDDAAEQLAIIAGQRPVITRAKNSIAGFKLREGMPIGCKVTLRGDRMYEFYDRLMAIALPRIRDFRGINPGSFDGRGNFSMGVREQIIFPEINYDDIHEVRGLTITITTSAATDDQARELLRAMGMPFATDEGRF